MTHADNGERAELCERAVQVARERALAEREDSRAALALWSGLVEGRWSLVERFEANGRRFYVAQENPPEVSAFASLDTKQRRLTILVGAGQSAKAAAYALGVGPSTVAMLLKVTLAKLGLRSRADLVRLVRAVGAAGVKPEESIPQPEAISANPC
jgi:DNA-binding CsgD family transcriptional regulator